MSLRWTSLSRYLISKQGSTFFSWKAQILQLIGSLCRRRKSWFRQWSRTKMYCLKLTILLALKKVTLIQIGDVTMKIVTNNAYKITASNWQTSIPYYIWRMIISSTLLFKGSLESLILKKLKHNWEIIKPFLTLTTILIHFLTKTTVRSIESTFPLLFLAELSLKILTFQKREPENKKGESSMKQTKKISNWPLKMIWRLT